MSGTGFGVVTGALVGIILSIVIIKICNKNGKFKTDYDERQEVIRGRGYKYAAYAMWIMAGLAMILDLGEVDLHMDKSILMFSMISISIVISISYFIWNDAYFGRNNNLSRYIILFAILTIFNGFIGTMGMYQHVIIVDGVLTWRAVSFECALIFLIIGIEYAVKMFVDKADEQEGE